MKIYNRLFKENFNLDKYVDATINYVSGKMKTDLYKNLIKKTSEDEFKMVMEKALELTVKIMRPQDLINAVYPLRYGNLGVPKFKGKKGTKWTQDF